jgi:hypothetical protein
MFGEFVIAQTLGETKKTAIWEGNEMKNDFRVTVKKTADGYVIMHPYLGFMKTYDVDKIIRKINGKFFAVASTSSEVTINRDPNNMFELVCPMHVIFVMTSDSQIKDVAEFIEKLIREVPLKDEARTFVFNDICATLFVNNNKVRCRLESSTMMTEIDLNNMEQGDIFLHDFKEMDV